MAESNGFDKSVTVRVVAADPILARALASRLQREIPAPVATNHVGEIGQGSIVVTTPTDCPPGRCRELVDSGIAVVVLAALPKRVEETAYAESGASAYLPMLGDGSNVADAVKDVLKARVTS